MILIRSYSVTVAFVGYWGLISGITQYNLTSHLDLSRNSAPFAISNLRHFALYVLFSCLLSSHDLNVCCNSNVFSCFSRVWRVRPLFKMGPFKLVEALRDIYNYVTQVTNPSISLVSSFSYIPLVSLCFYFHVLK